LRWTDGKVWSALETSPLPVVADLLVRAIIAPTAFIILVPAFGHAETAFRRADILSLKLGTPAVWAVERRFPRLRVRQPEQARRG
jgi:hypothetical protein